MVINMKINKYLTKISIIAAGVFLVTTCTQPTKPKNENELPNTTMANIPVSEDTLNAYVTLHWDGEDTDGYVTHYRYRYVTYHEFVGDSIVTEWRDTDSTSQTIAFESSDDLNFQKFEVKAVDNNGGEDPSPAVKKFYTVKAYNPETMIMYPSDNQDLFVLPQTNDWWQGIKIKFGSFDEDGEVVEYGYRIDSQGTWKWLEDTMVVLTPDEFAFPLTGNHTVEVVAKDNTGLIDPIPAVVTIKLFEPKFDKNILIIDETIEGSNTPGFTSDEEVDEFYNELFNPDSSLDYFENGLPPKNILGRYKLLIWHSDYNFDRHNVGEEKDYLIEYLQAGGKLVLSGWRIIKSFDLEASFPQMYDPESFLAEYLHVLGANECPSVDGAFEWARGRNGYPDIHVNLDIDAIRGFPYFGGLTNINIITPGAFTRNIFTFQCKEGFSDRVTFQDRSCAIRYTGSSFDIIIFGFPLLYIRPDEAKLVAQKVLEDLL